MTTSIKYILFCLLPLLLFACSDETLPSKSTTKFDHQHSATINPKKHNFEHKFAKQCVQRELKNSKNQYQDNRFDKPCMCIAKRIMRNLTAVEAKKFLHEKKSTHSLKMSFDEAAYFCLQDK